VAVTLLSILASDAIALPLSPAFPVAELKYILDDAEAKVLLATEKYASQARELLHAGLRTEPIFDIREKIRGGAISAGSIQFQPLEESGQRGGMMLYTSGTTSRPVSSFPYRNFWCWRRC
jgi:acyl-coenzyme A synthetase/AMP-(fatty) acid ligase